MDLSTLTNTQVLIYSFIIGELTLMSMGALLRLCDKYEQFKVIFVGSLIIALLFVLAFVIGLFTLMVI